MKANKIRIFTGTLAAIALMTGMTPAITFAKEADNTAIQAANNAEEQMLKSQQNASKDRKETETKEFNTHRRQNGEEVIEKIIYYDNGDYDEIYYLKNSGTIVEFFAFRQETDLGANVDTTVFDTRAKAYSAEQLRAELDGKTPYEIFKHIFSISTANAQNANKGSATENVNDTVAGEGNGLFDFFNDECKNVISEAIKKSVDSIPGADYFGGPLEDFLKGTVGIEEKKTDLTEVINNNHSELMKAMDAQYEREKECNVNAETLSKYGDRLDEFESEAQERAEAMKGIQDDKNLNDVQKTVRIAAIIGNSEDWNKNKIKLFKYMNSAARIFNGKPDVDPEHRNIYQVLYDYNKDESMFSGEAMDRAEFYIRERQESFLQSLNVAVELLNAHRKLSNLTEDEINSMDPKTRTLYDKTVTEPICINEKLRSITCIFTGDKDSKIEENRIGIFDTAADYYNMSRTIFINKGRSTVALEKKFDAVGAKELNMYNGFWDDSSKEYLNSQPLSEEEIDAIYNHAKENGWTISQYLTNVGFDYGSIFDVPDSYGAFLISGNSYYDDDGMDMRYSELGVKGYKFFTENNEGKSKCWVMHGDIPVYGPTKYLDPAKDQWSDGKDISLLTFRKAGDNYQRDIYNNK